jgi:hypothetical protein
MKRNGAVLLQRSVKNKSDENRHSEHVRNPIGLEQPQGPTSSVLRFVFPLSQESDLGHFARIAAAKRPLLHLRLAGMAQGPADHR